MKGRLDIEKYISIGLRIYLSLRSDQILESTENTDNY
jgi:hypothetical protein